ncbi:CvpA family protein [Flavobacterium sp. RHBU_3]|uniref:CvpA family protein n=1 Tax=Flavobacterium sp. RHBU_3 TaxID=3391184 RepID=UPI00398482D0
MKFLDIIIAALLVFGIVKGVAKGLFAELASLVALVVGLFIAVKFSGLFAGDKPGTGGITVFFITFVAAVVGVYMLAKVFTKLAEAGGLGWVNRLLGGLFGGIKVCLIVSVTLNFFLKINSTHIFASEQTLQDSLFFYPVLSVSNFIFPVLKTWFS